MAYTKQQIKEDKKNWWYWTERQNAITNKNIKETEAQLKKYYKSAMDNIIGQFEATYNKVLLSIEDGREPTPADLYKLDTYWKQQGELQKALTKLGDKQAEVLSKNFMNEWRHIYEGVAAKDDLFFSGVSFENAEQMINQIWCADGKNWSQRIWKNTELLQQELNDGLVDCLLAGRNPSELRQRLQERFNVAYSRADSVVRTEMTHIQTQAARQRYSDAGVKEVEVWADKDERRCDKCGKLHQKRFPVGGAMPIPAHPRCRCCILPVVDDDLTKIKYDDIIFGKSLGAAAKNYPVKASGNSRQHFKFAEGTNITDVVLIMGKGTNKPLADKYRIAIRNGIKNPDDIQKMSGNGVVVDNGVNRPAEIHWYVANGEEFEFKVKRYKDETKKGKVSRGKQYRFN